LTIFITSACREEDEDCHREIIIQNSTNYNILFGINFKNTLGNCNLSLSTINPKGSYELHINECWERSLADGHLEEFYIVDTSQFNDPTVFYDCDSIEIKNKILKHYKLTLEDLKKLDFTITYP
jgi:hypothetical protein